MKMVSLRFTTCHAPTSQSADRQVDHGRVDVVWFLSHFMSQLFSLRLYVPFVVSRSAMHGRLKLAHGIAMECALVLSV